MTDKADKPRHLLFVLHDAPAAAFGLKLAEMAVLRSLVSNLNSKRNGTEVWPSNATLAELTGAHPDTVVKAKLKLHEKQLIKIRRDTGKSDMCSINVELIRALASTPRKKQGGVLADPPEKAGGYPPEKPGGTPPKNHPRTAKGTAYPNSQPEFPSFAVPADLKVGDGDHQRKMAVHGLVAATAEKLTLNRGEQQTKNIPEGEPELPRTLAAGARTAKERPG